LNILDLLLSLALSKNNNMSFIRYHHTTPMSLLK